MCSLLVLGVLFGSRHRLLGGRFLGRCFLGGWFLGRTLCFRRTLRLGRALAAHLLCLRSRCQLFFRKRSRCRLFFRKRSRCRSFFRLRRRDRFFCFPAERHAEHPQQLESLLVGFGGGRDVHVEAAR